MTDRLAIASLILALLASPIIADESTPADARPVDQPATATVYLIGNSLTNDTWPERLDGTVQFHIDCGKSLPYIEANPDEPCKKSSRLWPDALAGTQYEQLSMQTHYRATMEQQVATISRWMAMQPGAKIIIHTGWAKRELLNDERRSDDLSGVMVHSPAWYDTLLTRLREAHPERSITRTRCADAIWRIADELESTPEAVPLDSLEDFYRDAIHVELGAGRYLMHNLMRQALGQPRRTDWQPAVDPAVKTYLDTQLDHWQRTPAP